MVSNPFVAGHCCALLRITWLALCGIVLRYMQITTDHHARAVSAIWPDSPHTANSIHRRWSLVTTLAARVGWRCATVLGPRRSKRRRLKPAGAGGGVCRANWHVYVFVTPDLHRACSAASSVLTVLLADVPYIGLDGWPRMLITSQTTLAWLRR